jgi:hypothetical protein
MVPCRDSDPAGTFGRFRDGKIMKMLDRAGTTKIPVRVFDSDGNPSFALVDW